MATLRTPRKHENTKEELVQLCVFCEFCVGFFVCRSQRDGFTCRDGHIPDATKTRENLALRALRPLRWLSRDHGGSVTAPPLAKAFGFLPVNTSRCPPGSVTRRSRVFHGVSTGPTIATRPTGSAPRARAASASTSPSALKLTVIVDGASFGAVPGFAGTSSRS